MRRFSLGQSLALIGLWVLSGVALAADYPINELPMFGNKPKTPAMLAADQKFLAAIDESGLSRPDAADKICRKGWAALSGKDVKTAILRLNQAWLLNPENACVHWGFAVVSYVRDKNLDASAAFFERARQLRPKDGDLLGDYARTMEEGGRPEAAERLALEALAINPENHAAHVVLARRYIEQGRLQEAKEHAAAARKLEERGLKP